MAEDDFFGVWRIKEMELWDKEGRRGQEEGRIEFLPKECGNIRFDGLKADITFKVKKEAEGEKVEFLFEGMDEGNPVSGRGWGKIEGPLLKGRIYLHFGEDSDFLAFKEPE
jgi:hypothetical protein